MIFLPQKEWGRDPFLARCSVTHLQCFTRDYLRIAHFNFLILFQYDIPTYMGMVEEEVKDELMDTDVPSEGRNSSGSIYENSNMMPRLG